MPRTDPINSEAGDHQHRDDERSARALRRAREQIAAEIVGAQQVRDRLGAWKRSWTAILLGLTEMTGPRIANSRIATTSTRPMRPVGLRQMSARMAPKPLITRPASGCARSADRAAR